MKYNIKTKANTKHEFHPGYLLLDLAGGTSLPMALWNPFLNSPASPMETPLYSSPHLPHLIR